MAFEAVVDEVPHDSLGVQCLAGRRDLAKEAALLMDVDGGHRNNALEHFVIPLPCIPPTVALGDESHGQAKQRYHTSHHDVAQVSNQLCS